MPATRRIPALPACHAAVAIVLSGCALPVENHNQPDRQRIYSDPSTIAASLTGAVRTWVNSRQAGAPALLLSTLADSYTAPWKNFDMFPYSSEPRIAWANVPGGANGDDQEVLERGWYGPYSAMATANDILRAIRGNGVSLDEPGGSQTATRRAETVSVMLQGTVLAMIALNYDSGFVATEETHPTEFITLPVLSRQQLRDTALARFEEAIRLAEANPFTTVPEWLGVGGGPTYTSAQLVQLIRTMAAELLAMAPRNAAENAQVDWARVVALASGGLSVPPAFDFEFVTDWQVPGLYDELRDWSNDITAVRVDNRLAHLLSPNQVHPWPAPNGNPPPVTADRRLGDGTYGPEDNYLDMQGFAATEKAGTDFAWAGKGQIFQANRGTYHSSNIGRHRYDCAVYSNEVTQGRCQVPLYTAAFNDLLWAEGLIRSNGDRGLAAALINKTRVGRGGLPPLTGAEPQDQLLAALQYEQEIEMMDIGPTVFYNRRRIDGLQPMTPRHMPMPFKELDLLRRELYTYGGPDGPDMSAAAAGGGGRIRTVREIYREMEARWWAEVRARRPW
jgi:hypothetical protein